MRRSQATRIALLAVSLLLSGCGADEQVADPGVPAVTTPGPSSSVSTGSTSGSVSRGSTSGSLGSTPPDWLGTRVLPRTEDGFGQRRPTPPELRVRRFTLPDTLPPLPGTGFAARITDPAPRAVIARSTWSPGCPVAAVDLAWVRLTFRGFDGDRHSGELLVHREVATDVVSAFRRMYDARFPIEQMRITTRADLEAAPTGDGNNTSAFSCRPIVGGTTFSQHAYGRAVDVNPFQNPYTKGDLLLPELAGAYLDRDRVRPGMILGDGPVVRAFDAIGWTWGGTWRTASDRHHFSENGR